MPAAQWAMGNFRLRTSDFRFRKWAMGNSSNGRQSVKLFQTIFKRAQAHLPSRKSEVGRKSVKNGRQSVKPLQTTFKPPSNGRQPIQTTFKPPQTGAAHSNHIKASPA
jgi:hypothetical protein